MDEKQLDLSSLLGTAIGRMTQIKPGNISREQKNCCSLLSFELKIEIYLRI